MTLQEMFDQSYKHYLNAKGTRISTIKDVQETITRWNRIVGSQETDSFQTFGEIDVSEITEELIWRFTARQSVRVDARFKMLSPNTVRKYLRNLKSLLRFAVKRKLLAVMPDMMFPDEELRNAKDTFTRDEIRRLLKATSMFKGKDIAGIDGEIWWRNLMTVIYNTAIRSGTALLMEFDWVQGRQLTIRKSPGVKSDYQVPLNEEAIRAIGTMRELVLPPFKHRIFPWPFRKEYLQKQLKKLCIVRLIAI